MRISEMDINTAAQILFRKNYEQLNDREAEEAHDFREMHEQMAHEEMLDSLYLDHSEWGDQ